MQLSVCMTVHNEEKTIREVINRFYKVLNDKRINFEIIVLDNGSTDNTLREIQIAFQDKNPIRVDVIQNTRMMVYLDAVKKVISHTIGKYVFFTDADLQYTPEEILEFYNTVYGWDMVIGVKVRRKDPFLRILMSLGFHVFTNIVFCKWFKDADTGFRLFTREVVDTIVPQLKYLTYSPLTELTLRAYKQGYHITELGITHAHRKYGRSKNVMNIRQVIHTQLHGLFQLWRELIWY